MIIESGDNNYIKKRLNIMSQIIKSTIERCQYISHFHNGISYDECLVTSLPELEQFEEFIKEVVLKHLQAGMPGSKLLG